MKISILFVGALLMILSLKAQYTMNTTLKTYEELVEPISLNNGNIWNEVSTYPIYFNFNFHISGQTYTALNVQAGGGINLPGLGTKELAVYHTPFGGYLLKDKGISSSLSDISYEIIGSAGHKILKIQWKNAGFVQWYSASDTADYVDFQLWLYEIDDHIEIHFGANSTDPGTYGYPDYSDTNPGTSIRFMFDQCSNVFGITGPCNLPSYWIYNDCSWNPSFIDGTPSIDITYNIYPSTSEISDLSENSILILPNPSKGKFSVTQNSDMKFIEVYNLLGEIVYKSGIINNDANEIDLTHAPKGIYFVKVENEEKVLIEKIVLN